MNHAHNGPDRAMNTGKAPSATVRTKDDPLGIDDIGLPEEARTHDARNPGEVRPEPAAVQGGADPKRAPDEDGSVDRNGKRSAAQTKVGTVDPALDKAEKAARVIDPPGHEVKDEDILDPGRMTPGAPPVDNRS